MAKKKGLGDVIKAVTDAVGIEQCPTCKKNQSWLNVNFAFNKPKPLTQEQKDELNNVGSIFKNENGRKIMLRKDPDYLKIYNDCFNQEVQPEQFTGGVKKAILKKLKQLQDYEN